MSKKEKGTSDKEGQGRSDHWGLATITTGIGEGGRGGIDDEKKVFKSRVADWEKSCPSTQSETLLWRGQEVLN